MDETLAHFGLRVRILREKQQLTIEGLAARARMDPAHLGLIERGNRNVTLLTMAKIAHGLNVPIGHFFGDRK